MTGDRRGPPLTPAQFDALRKVGDVHPLMTVEEVVAFIVADWLRTHRLMPNGSSTGLIAANDDWPYRIS